jgi:hypothetical protein
LCEDSFQILGLQAAPEEKLRGYADHVMPPSLSIKWPGNIVLRICMGYLALCTVEMSSLSTACAVAKVS